MSLAYRLCFVYRFFFAKAQNDTVIFSVPGGFYEEVFQLKLYNFFQQNHIRYTTNGNRARRQPQKGLKIYAREEYGKKRFKHRFFENSMRDSFKHLVIKPYSSLYPFSGIQDYICSQAAIDLGLESGLSRPVVLYLNGEYWGIYFLQEKMDERYLEDHFNINLNHCMIVGNWYGAITHGLRAAVLR